MFHTIIVIYNHKFIAVKDVLLGRLQKQDIGGSRMHNWCAQGSKTQIRQAPQNREWAGLLKQCLAMQVGHAGTEEKLGPLVMTCLIDSIYFSF